jgi:hypothetical protein
MAIYCPITKTKVLYLTCLECENKICKEVENKQDTTKETAEKSSKQI